MAASRTIKIIKWFTEKLLSDNNRVSFWLMCKFYKILLQASLLLFVMLIGCNKKEYSNDKKLFSKISSEVSHITFNNAIQPFESDTLNALEFDPLFNGGGIGVGDFNNDGFQDVFFAGNLVSSKFYINKGSFQFEDVTEKTGLATTQWCTGVSVADVNQDGKLDIYVCVAGKDTSRTSRSNLLFINQGNDAHNFPTFKEEAKAYGLDDSGFSIQAAFFDYDRDGDLDCYVLTNAVEKTGRNRIRPKRNDGKGPSTDKLYENTGEHNGRPIFKDVSKTAGILKEGYGLGLCITDIDKDGWLDIYCANDFVSNDLLWINNHDGTFTDRAAEYFKHTSYNSMGVDVQDFNNDGLADICVVDMLPESIERKKMMVIKTSWEYFQLARQMGYQDEYVRNVLQLNQGKDTHGNARFSEISQLAGIHATDWSWAPLLMDLDHDGYKDLLVTNGYRRDITNLDYVIYLNQEASSYGNQFAPDARKKMIDALYRLPEVKIHNYIYRNKGDLTFEDKSIAWGLAEKNYTNGAAYVDLDNDGDLDLLFNNIDDKASVYRNDCIASQNTHFVKLQLKNTDKKNVAVGASVSITLANGEVLYQENLVVRGFMSSVDPILNFGLGKFTTFTTEIRWADGRKQILDTLQADTFHEIAYSPNDSLLNIIEQKKVYLTMLPADSLGLSYQHIDFPFDEFKRTPALPHVFSRNSPSIAIGDADNNGLDDIFIGADRGVDRSLFLQKTPGQFIQQVQGKNDMEDMGSVFFDADRDGDEDLYVVSGGSLYTEENGHMYQDRLYINDGTGKLTRGQNLLPEIKCSGGTVVSADFDRDGDLDVFRGSRVTAGKYPQTPRSFLLRNNGKGKFEDITKLFAPNLERVGMVSTALWTDYNNDGWFDLIVAGEFMAITFFKNQKGQLVFDNNATIKNSEGWWNSLTSADFDLDGDIDYIAGNLGLNTQYKASDKEPVKVYAADFDGNGSIDPIITYYHDGKEYPIAIRDVMYDQITAIMRKRFVSYSAYAGADINKVLTSEERREAQVLKAYEMRTSYIENKGNGYFALKPLPNEAQFSPVYGSVVNDFNNDGLLDVLLVGNSYASETYSGWLDASFGTLLLGNAQGDFTVSNTPLEFGFDTKALAQLYAGNELLIVASNNNGPVQVAKPAIGKQGKILKLQKDDAWAIIKLKSGRTQKVEFYYGSGYLSQSSRVIILPVETMSVNVYSFTGKVRDANF